MNKSYRNIIAAACLWGCIGVFLKLLTAAGLTSMQGVALRSLVGCLFYRSEEHTSELQSQR